MSIFNFLSLDFIKAIFNFKYVHERFIKNCEETYHRYEIKFPHRDPHFYLSQTYLAYFATYHGANINDERLKPHALPATYFVACVPPPLCARVLGINLLTEKLRRECPSELDNDAYKVFAEEWNKINKPLTEAWQVAQRNGDVEKIEQLYKKNNPGMDFPIMEAFEWNIESAKFEPKNI